MQSSPQYVPDTFSLLFWHNYLTRQHKHKFMSRTLNPKDLEILKKLAPEIDSHCKQAGHQFRSIIPPLSHHLATSSDDFIERLERLDDDELTYLAELVFEGMEDLTCANPEHVFAFCDLIKRRVSKEQGEKVAAIYSMMM